MGYPFLRSHYSLDFASILVGNYFADCMSFFWRSDGHMDSSHVATRNRLRHLKRNARDQCLLCAIQKETGDICRFQLFILFLLHPHWK